MLRRISDLLRLSGQQEPDKNPPKRQRTGEGKPHNDRTTKSELTSLFRSELKGTKRD